ncbi:DUF4143 domain-containing protein [Rickettsia oklahomensis]|uniref:DUF4143 domain-containing protein n=1 Tax=Rickettsia oklahomensis TaxID=3141789 RepID=A0AAU7C051_9RICK
MFLEIVEYITLYLLGLNNYEALSTHPKISASCEGLVLEQIIRCDKTAVEECYFWSSHNGAEVDLLIFKNGTRLVYKI